MEFDMAFQLKGNRKETENKTIRFPIHLIDQIEQAISDSDQDITFSSFVIQACEYALDHCHSFLPLQRPLFPLQGFPICLYPIIA